MPSFNNSVGQCIEEISALYTYFTQRHHNFDFQLVSPVFFLVEKRVSGLKFWLHQSATVTCKAGRHFVSLSFQSIANIWWAGCSDFWLTQIFPRTKSRVNQEVFWISTSAPLSTNCACAAFSPKAYPICVKLPQKVILTYKKKGPEKKWNIVWIQKLHTSWISNSSDSFRIDGRFDAISPTIGYWENIVWQNIVQLCLCLQHYNFKVDFETRLKRFKVEKDTL